MAGRSVADGHLSGHCTTRQRFADFRTFLEEVILPEALGRQVKTLILIQDHGTTHAPKQLAHWLEEQREVSSGRLAIEGNGLPTNASWLDHMEIWLRSLQRKLLQPNHFLSTNPWEQAISDCMASSNQTAKPINWSDTLETLEK